MDGNQTLRIKCDIDFTLMGLLNYTELMALHDLSISTLLQSGWRVDWYENVQSIAQDKRNNLSSIAPNEFYEKLYNVVDLGLLHFEYIDEEKRNKKISIYIHDSILPSYQIRASISLSFTSHQNIFKEIWKQIKITNSLIRNIARTATLSPTIDTWTICFASNEKEALFKSNLVDNTTDLLSSLFGEEPIIVESASVIEESLRVLKLLGQGCEQYLIISFDIGDELAISRLYYLMLAKGRIKHLLGHLKQAHVDSVKKLQQETQKYQTITKVKPTQISKILNLRSNILKNWGEFRVIRSHIDLAFSFLTFHVGSYFENSKETPIIKYMPGIIRSENTQVQLFFVGPLKDLVKRLEEDIQEALDLVASVIEIFNIDVNLRLQMLMWRLQLISVGIAVISLVIAILAVIK